MTRILLLCILLGGLTVSCKAPATGGWLVADQGRCTGCGDCLQVCPTTAIRIIDRKAVIDPAACLECGRCVEACPKDAIQ